MCVATVLQYETSNTGTMLPSRGQLYQGMEFHGVVKHSSSASNLIDPWFTTRTRTPGPLIDVHVSMYVSCRSHMPRQTRRITVRESAGGTADHGFGDDREL